jgi:membrane-bound lytic murein transglycosylase D
LDPKLLKRLNEYSIYRKLKVGGQVILPFKVGQNRRESMYSDLYERSRKRSRRKRISLLKRIRIAKIRGKRILRPTRYYKVKRGDTLWKISNVTGTSLDTLIVSNVKILENRKIREGDRLIIR